MPSKCLSKIAIQSAKLTMAGYTILCCFRCSPLYSTTIDRAGANWESKIGWEWDSWFTRLPDGYNDLVHCDVMLYRVLIENCWGHLANQTG